MTQLLTNIKTQYNLLKHKVLRAGHILTSPPRQYVKVQHIRDGKVIYENAAALIDQGEESILKSYFQASDILYTPSGFKVNLVTDASILETATTYTAVTGTGYAEVSVARDAVDWSAAFSGGDWRVTSKICTFVASASNWTTAEKVVLEATLNAVDKLIAYADLSTPRTLVSGDTLVVTIILSLA